MLEKFEEKDNKTKGIKTAYSNYIRLDKMIIMSRNWLKNKNTLLNSPCDPICHSIYAIAKVINANNPMSFMMPGVYFNEDYCSSDYESWEELYLKDDVFISVENLHNEKHRAYSLETLFLANKYRGYLRAILCYDDKEATEMSPLDQERFLCQLKKRYPAYYKEYQDAQPSKKELVLASMSKEKLNIILDVVEVMLVLSCHKNGLSTTFLPGGLTDSLSAYGYQFLTQVLSEHLTPEEREGLKSVWAKNIRSTSEKTVAELIESALNGSCTSTLGLYWLGLLKTLRPRLTLAIDEKFAEKIYTDLLQDKSNQWSNLPKQYFMLFLKKNAQYIVTEILNPLEMDVRSKANGHLF
ncbi:hypothetical protein [Legionella erythra]|uniref:Uncharacterized protein n=1 Tax=Legionella erythra TaxID=448 RepID=A0A0W0TF72_LEGER|nr:hypothetical protein [Legionella erythra]KTC94192.1 hypothetical protein Lery_2359 [Legionella erythra]